MKYELTNNTENFNGIKLFQIRALKSFGSISKGELGGWVESEKNLSQAGNAWVFGNAQVSGNAQVFGNAWVFGNAQVSGNAWVFGNAQVYGNAWVFGNAQVFGNAWVFGNAQVSGNAWVFGNAQVSGNAWVFGNAWVSGDARVFGNAYLSAKFSFTKGWFIGGDDTGKITDITSQTGSTYWKNQYVLGDYEIIPIEEPEKEEGNFSGKTVEVKIGDKTYTATIH